MVKHIKYLLLLAAVTLTGCANTPNLPPTETIVAIKPIDSGIIASSEKHSYRFFREGMPQEYQRYNTFYQRFHQQASGVRVNFAVKDHEVTAEYLVVIDKRNVDASQQTILRNEYKATTIDSDHLGVMFKANGFWSDAYSEELAAPYRLEQPIVVSINDKTQTLTTAGSIALIPLFPLFMIYGCATGPCV